MSDKMNKLMFIPIFLMALLVIPNLVSAQPSNIVSYYPVYLNNTQTSATPAPFQAMITANLSTMSSIIYNGSFSNMEFYYPSNNTIIPSWIESNSSGNLTIWLNISAGIPASTNETVYMGLSNSTTNMLNNSTNGEAPQLSPTYAEYDDGADVFPNYWNFAGTTLPSGWVTDNQAYTVNNGLTLSPAPAPSCPNYIGYNTTIPIPFIMDSNVAQWSSNSGTSYGEVQLGAGASFSCLFNAWWSGIVEPNTAQWQFQVNNGTGSATNIATPSSGVFSEFYTSSTTGFLTNYIQTISTTTSGVNSALYIGSQVQNTASGDTVFNWIRTRAYPPNGVMPSVNFGAVQSSTAPLSVSVSPTSTTLDIPQSITLTATVSNGTSPYTYQWYNTTSGSAIAISGATSSTYTVVSDATGTFSYNVTVTDAEPKTASSNTATVVVNPQLQVNLTAQNSIITEGQEMLLNVNITGGTANYNIKIYNQTIGSMNSNCSLNTLFYSTTQPDSIQPSAPIVVNTAYCVVITDSATTPETAVSSTANPAVVYVMPTTPTFQTFVNSTISNPLPIYNNSYVASVAVPFLLTINEPNTVSNYTLDNNSVYPVPFNFNMTYGANIFNFTSNVSTCVPVYDNASMNYSFCNYANSFYINPPTLLSATSQPQLNNLTITANWNSGANSIILGNITAYPPILITTTNNTLNASQIASLPLPYQYAISNQSMGLGTPINMTFYDILTGNPISNLLIQGKVTSAMLFNTTYGNEFPVSGYNIPSLEINAPYDVINNLYADNQISDLFTQNSSFSIQAITGCNPIYNDLNPVLTINGGMSIQTQAGVQTSFLLVNQTLETSSGCQQTSASKTFNVGVLNASDIGAFNLNVFMNSIQQISANVQVFLYNPINQTFQQQDYVSTPTSGGIYVDMLNNATYDFNIYNNQTGALLGTVDGMSVFCSEGTVCSLSLYVNSTTPITNLQQSGSVISNCTSSYPTSKTLQCSATDSAEAVSGFTLIVNNIGIAGIDNIYNNTLTGVTASFTADLPYANATYNYFLYADYGKNEVLVNQGIIPTTPQPVSTSYTDMGYFAGFIILALLSLLALSKPLLTIGLDVFGIIVLGLIGFAIVSYIMIIQLIVIAIVYMYKMRR